MEVFIIWHEDDSQGIYHDEYLQHFIKIHVSLLIEQTLIQLSIQMDLRLLWFRFTSTCDLSEKLAPPTQPIRYRGKTNPNIVTRVFPRFKQVVHFHFENLNLNLIYHQINVGVKKKTVAFNPRFTSADITASITFNKPQAKI